MDIGLASNRVIARDPALRDRRDRKTMQRKSIIV